MELRFGSRDSAGTPDPSHCRDGERLEVPPFEVDEPMRRHLVGLAAEQGVSVQRLLEKTFGSPHEPDLAELEEQRRRLYDFLFGEYRTNVDPEGTRADWERWLAEGTPAEEIPAEETPVKGGSTADVTAADASAADVTAADAAAAGVAADPERR